MAELPPDWTPPPRSLLYARTVPPEQGGGMEIGCDCGTITQLIIDSDGAVPALGEMAFTCGGCQSVHWFTVGPGVAGG